MKINNLQCPQCGNELEIIARGKAKRFYGCSKCSGDENEPILYYQPIVSLKAVRKLEQGALIDLSVKQKSLLEE